MYKHSLLVGDVCPARQAVQDDDPAIEYVFTGQEAQLFPVVPYIPAGHEVQDTCPVWPCVYVPAGQTGQTETLTELAAPGGVVSICSIGANGTGTILSIIISSCRTIISYYRFCRGCRC